MQFIEFTLFFVMLFIYVYIELCTKMLTLEGGQLSQCLNQDWENGTRGQNAILQLLLG